MKNLSIVMSSLLLAVSFIIFFGCELLFKNDEKAGSVPLIIKADGADIGNGNIDIEIFKNVTLTADTGVVSDAVITWTISGNQDAAIEFDEISGAETSGASVKINGVTEGAAAVTVKAERESYSSTRITINISVNIPVVYYSEFGAKGDGISDDFDAIIAAHTAANKNGARVRADAGKRYYIGGANKTARVETDTDWTGAEFIIDDTKVSQNGSAWHDSWIFDIASAQQSANITSVTTLKKDQGKLNLSLPSGAVLVAADSNVKRYIRRGLDANSGADQTDIFIVDKNGNVDPSAPIIWDFDSVTSLVSYPIDEKKLTVRGGIFTTIANTGNAGSSYMKRGIRILRSNTAIDGLTHLVTGESGLNAPYDGFIKLENCANVTIQNTRLTGHVYGSIGTYDINANRTVNLSIINCDQTNDITDQALWGIFASNYSKNILFDRVKFSRFDAHQGVLNATILNSELGWQGITIIGCGLLRVENTKVAARLSFISFRDDYGSTWEGDVIIRNCTFAPPGSQLYPRLISTENDGQWDFGYPCCMPGTITIDGLVIDDASMPAGYAGVYLIYAVNTESAELYPFTLAKTIYLSGYESSKPYRIWTNYVRDNITIIEEP